MAASTQSQSSPDAGLSAALTRAIDDLEKRVRGGERKSCESILRAYPDVAADKDSLLELIYTEYVLRQELGQAAPIADWIARFPEWQADLEALFQVDAYVQKEVDSDADTKWAGARPRHPERQGEKDGLGRIGRFRLLEEIGYGGMGVVYRAQQLDLDRIVAIKMITGTDALSPEVRRRFRAEAEAAAKLQHPHIVQILEVGNDDRQPYFSMEYISGGSLETLIRRNPLAAMPAARLAECLARAIHFAHGKGIIHRDLKPANILLSPSDQPDAIALREGAQTGSYEPKITDFGLAKHTGAKNQQTATVAALGTPSYMAPEQASGDAAKATAATDVYSLGALLYDMLAGRPPFHAATVNETLEQVRKDDPAPLRQLQPDIPGDLETICMKCLRKDRSKRYANASDLADDLARFIAGKPIRARRASFTEQFIKWMRRHPAKASFLAAVVLGVLGITWQWQRAEQHRVAAEGSADDANRARAAEKDERDRVQRMLYAHDLSLANYEHQSNNSSRALQLLASCPERLRHWEWNFIDQVCKERTWQFGAFELPTRGVALSPDGSMAAACSGVWGTQQQGEIRLWDLKKGVMRWSSRVHPGPVMDIQFDHSGKRIISAGTMFGRRTPAGLVIVWDANSGSELWRQEAASSHTAAFTPNDQRVVIAHSNGLIAVHDAATGKLERNWRGHAGNINDLSFWPDGKRFVTGGRDGFFRIWEIDSGEKILEVPFGDTRRTTCCSDGRGLAVCAHNGKAMVYDFHDQHLRETHEFHLGNRVGAFEFSSDGQYLVVSALNQAIRLIDPKSGRVAREFHGHNGDALDAAMSRDGMWLATSGLGESVSIWNLAADRNEFSKTYVGPFLKDVEYSPSGKYVAMAMGFNTNGARYDDQTVKLWNTTTRDFVPGFRGHTDWLTGVAIDPQERWVLSGSLDKTARLWSFPDGRPGPVLMAPTPVMEVAFTEKGDTAVTVESDGSLRTWNAADGSPKANWNAPGSVACMASHPKEFLIATSGDSGVVWLWRKTGGEPQRLTPDGASRIMRLAFSTDGDWLAAARDDATIDVWKVADLKKTANGALWATLRGHTGAVTGLDFSHEGNRLASCGKDRTIRLWDVESGHEVLSLPSVGMEAVCPQITFSFDGNTILHVDQMQLNTWSVLPERKIDINAWRKQEAETARLGGHWYAAAIHFGALKELEPDVSRHASQQAQALARLGRLSEAETVFGQAIAYKTAGDTFDHLRLALVQLDQKKFAEHDATCERFWNAYKESTDPFAANNLTWCFARRTTMPHAEEIVALAEKAVARNAESSAMLNTLGAVYLRAGQIDKAIETLEKSMQKHGKGGTPYDFALLAIANAKLGNHSAGQALISKTRQWLAEQDRRLLEHEPVDPLDQWDVRLELAALLQEFESLKPSN